MDAVEFERKENLSKALGTDDPANAHLRLRPATHDSGGGSLSPREGEVLRWLAVGKSGGEIAIILDISVCTVRMHIRNIIGKLGTANIPHAVARGFQMGILGNSHSEV